MLYAIVRSPATDAEKRSATRMGACRGFDRTGSRIMPTTPMPTIFADDSKSASRATIVHARVRRRCRPQRGSWVVLIRIALLLLATVSEVAAASGFAQRFHSAQWTREDGLPSNTIADIAQTPDGFLWVATAEGLARYDGSRFKIFNRRSLPILESDIITKLDVDSVGRLWVATLTGGVYYKDANGWHRVAAPVGEEWIVINLALGADGDVWAGTNIGMARIRPSPSGYVFDADVVDRGQPVTFVSASGGDVVSYIRRGTKGVREYAAGWASARDSAMPDAKRFSRLWQTRSGIAVFDWGSGVHLIEHRAPPRRIAFEKIPDVADVRVDTSGTIWLATLDRGLIAVMPDGETVAMAQTFERLGGVVRDVFQARDGSIWIGTDKHGLIRLRRPEVSFFEFAGGKPLGYVNAVAESPDGRIHIATTHGVAEYSSATNAFVWSDKPNLAREGLAFGMYAGRSLVVSQPSLRLVEVASGETIEIDRGPWPPNRNILALRPEENGGALIATTHGIAAIRDGLLRPYEPAEEGPMTMALFERVPGEIWAGSVDRLRMLKRGRFVDHPYASALRGKWVSGFASAPGDGVWIATYGDGAFLARDGRTTHFHEAAGFPKNNLNGLVRGRGGFLWLLTNSGIYRVREEALTARDARDATPVPAKAYGRAHGLAYEETSGGQQPPAVLARDGSLWFATSGGVARIGPQAQTTVGAAPRVHVDDVRADASFERADQHALVFAKGTRAIEIDVSAPDLIDGKSILIRYRIRGFDPDWKILRGERTVHLGNLPPGSHTLEMMASNDEGRWIGKVESVTLRIVPFFHQTLWFKALLVALMAGAVYGFHRVRLSVLKSRYAVMEERARIAAELHDGIAQGFSGIALQIEAALADERVPEGSAQRMQRARTLAVSSMDDIRRSVRLLSAETDGGYGAVECVRAALRESPVPDSVNVVFVHTGVPFELSQSALHHIDRIVRQAVANAVEHASPEHIRVSLSFDPGRLRLTIEDDGNGGAAPASAPTLSSSPAAARGFGSVSLQKRAEAIGARLTISAERGTGTRLKLTLRRRGLRGFMQRVAGRLRRVAGSRKNPSAGV